RGRALPQEEGYTLRRHSFERGVSELQPGERADVSWITEETPDRLGDVVLASGMDDSHFQLNPIVTLNHACDQPPVGRSLWRRKVREGTLRGVKAKTHYPPRPEAWTGAEWLPDFAYEMVKADLLRGKSIGFFPLKVRTPTAEEIGNDPRLANVRFIIEEWLLAEYACCYLPMQPHAVVEQISKAVAGGRPGCLAPPFVSVKEIDKALSGYLRAADLEAMIAGALARGWRKECGRAHATT